LKGLYQNLWRSLDTRRWKNSKTSHVFESLLLTAKMSLTLLFCQLASAKVLFIRFYRRCFLSYIAFFVIRLRISLLLFVSPLEYIRVQQVETLSKLGIQAVHRTD
jgi:hypothetical protein